MKHFKTQTGGRHTYTDDVINLQELALAINAIFDGCDNFIVKGCEIDKGNIAPGIVYINGELRNFNGATGISQWPVYLCENNKNENVAYESGGQKVGRTLYGVEVKTSAPTSVDAITGKVPEYILIKQTGGLTLRDAFFGKYAILSSALANLQEIKTNLKIDGETTITEGLTLLDGLFIGESQTGKVYQEGDSIVIEYKSSDNATCKLIISKTGGYEFSIAGTTVLKVNSNIETSISIVAPSANIGNFRIDGNNIYNTATTDEGCIYINYSTPNNANYRNTVIGDGKGVELLTINGKNASIKANGEFSVEGGESSLILKGNVTKTSANIIKKIVWKDLDGDEMAIIGFDNSSNRSFTIQSKLASVVIDSIGGLDVVGNIKEDGKLLSEKYVLTENLTEALGSYALKDTSYSKADTDSKYSTKTGGLLQFITDSNTTQILRNQIEAISLSDVTSKCPTLDNFLADMAKDATSKKKIRDNIGAAPAGSYQSKMNDTGWIEVTKELWARQFGDMVFIQGIATTQKYDKTVFTLPNGIGSPAAAAVFNSVDHSFTAYISGGSRECKAWKCGNSNERIYFSMTYMTN